MCDQTQFHRSLRAKPFVRPKPLRRGEGVGGGNYVRLKEGVPPQHRQGSTAEPPIRRRPTSAGCSRAPPKPASASSPSTSAENVCTSNSMLSRSSAGRARPSSAPTYSRPRYSQSPSKPVECELKLGVSKSHPPRSSTYRAADFNSARSPTPGPSGLHASRSPIAGTSRGDEWQPCPSDPSGTTRSSRDPNGKTGPTRPLSRGAPYSKKPPPSEDSNPARALSSGKPEMSSARPSARPSTAKAQIKGCVQRPQATSSLIEKRNPPSMPTQPGPSCLRPPPSGPKRKIQFVGVSPPNSSDTRSKYMPKRARTTYGPNLYPIFPDQYESPLRSIPGPRQVLLMPGDINPNETTIIDIVELDEGDIQQVPFIPPHAPANLLADSRRVQEGGDRSQAAPGARKRLLSSNRLSSKKNTPNDKMAVGEGRPFSFSKFGNITGKDLPISMYRGPSYSRPNPECAREMPFKSRKTVVRPFLEEERIALEEARAFRAMRLILEETDARIQADRASRGLTDDDLLDIDAEVSTPTKVRRAPRDVFEKTDKCKFPKNKVPLTPPERMSPNCPTNYQTEDLIRWEDGEVIPYDQGCESADYFIETSTRYSRSSPTSPMLMGMDDPEEDLLGLYSPPKRASCPRPQSNQSDLMEWDSPVERALPYDEGFDDENFFDTVTRRSPTSAKTPPLSYLREQMNYKEFMLVCHPQLSNSSGETRIVRAVPLRNDPNTVVLEDSPLARGEGSVSVERFQETSDIDDDSFGLLDNVCDDNEPWLTEENFEETFHRRRPGTSRDISGIQTMDTCDDDNLALLNEDWNDMEFDSEVDAKFRSQARYQTIFQPLAEGGEMLDDEVCPIDYELEQVGRDFEKEFADFLHLEHEPDVSDRSEKLYGRFGSELVEKCKCPIEEYTDMLGIYSPNEQRPPQRRDGPYTKELLEECPDEQQLIDLSEECPTTPPIPPPQFGYSRDLFSNIKWDPSMAPNPKKKKPENGCPV